MQHYNITRKGCKPYNVSGNIIIPPGCITIVV